ncbi:MAG TPA: 4-alpha-glucanotransferase [Candidatus Dormibacteraeota bacterium]|nr:4-alpha-glucanotransferase [Candidatus Dormibacteraeota bacterium]
MSGGAIDPRAAVMDTYVDAWGIRRSVPASAREAVLAAMGLDPAAPPPSGMMEPVRLGRPGQALAPEAELVLEDGTTLGRVDRLPRDLPFGYHRLRREGEDQLLLMAPARCHLPAGMRAWGWAAQLYGARSRRSWGIGDLGDLRMLADWSADLGAEAILLNPLGAVNPGPLPEPSPYYPSTRRFRNPLYLAVEAVPGRELAAAELAPIARAARKLNADRRIDRSAVLRHKLAALECIWAAGGARAPAVRDRLATFEAAGGGPLRQWATFAALAEVHGPAWPTWPAGLRRPEGSAVAAAARRLGDRVAFHAWIQWLLDIQLAAAGGAGVDLIADLPIGFDPAGFDAWAWQRQLALDVALGAPPDPFNLAGQDWGLPPFVPNRLRQAGYAPFIETIRATLRSARGLRIDHVLGLFRQWWVPRGSAPAGGAYVAMPSDELLAILAIESRRAGAIVIGEDLGTVAAGVRRRLAAARILSIRLAFFERRPPTSWPRAALAAVTTHDLPTIAGLWAGADLLDQQRAGVPPDAAAAERLLARLTKTAGVSRRAPLEKVVLAAHAAIAAAPSVLAVANLEDALLVPERPNLPGTMEPARDNWSLALPASLESMRRDPIVARLARALRR